MHNLMASKEGELQGVGYAAPGRPLAGEQTDIYSPQTNRTTRTM